MERQMFKVGDVVRLKKTKSNTAMGTFNPVRITAIEDGEYIYTGEHGGGWLPDRFEFVADALTDTTDAANYYHAIVGYSNAESVS